MVGVGGYDYFLVVVVVRRVSLPDSFLAGVRLPGAIVILFPWKSRRSFTKTDIVLNLENPNIVLENPNIALKS